MLIFSFGAIYKGLEDIMNVGRLITVAITWKVAFWFFTLSMPNLSAYLIMIQCIDVTTTMIRNYHTQILPQSKNGRLIREKYNVTPPPAYKNIEGKVRSD